MSSRTQGAAVYMPLFLAAATGADDLIPMHEDERTATLNLGPGWETRLRTIYGAAFTPENLIGYLYAVLTSEAYPERFAGELEDDFPRVPFAADPTDFELVATEGAALVRLHLLEDTTVALPRIEGAGGLTISEPRYLPETQQLGSMRLSTSSR